MPLVAKLLILSIAAQALLTVAILVLMGRERVPRVMSGEIPMADIAVERTAYPLRARLLSNSFDNQFQLPVLFYVAALLALLLGGVTWLEVVAAWLFVALRYVHAIIHVTTNHVLRRFTVYSAGLAVLVILWLMVLFRVFLT
ncbi:MAPEG family protein [Devosia beringensis]|uniref:MAPEG family protein n=1 Tax=Devosia beringensis TaxID=2657486 RepID=UPI00186BAA3E|nr:MAPEG family protein [Devosia beringensis]